MSPADILASLEKLTGPSREVDADIYEALGYEVKRKPERIVTTWRAGWTKPWAYFDTSTRRWVAMGRLTYSLDAIVALIEQATGNASWRAGNTPSGRGFAFLGTSQKEHDGATPAIALGIALLKALESGQ